MLKNIIQWHETIDGKEFNLFLDNDTPTTSIKEMATIMIKYAGYIEDQVKAQKEQQEAEQQDNKIEEIQVEQ